MSWDEDATPRQKMAIARLCDAAGIREELEQRAMSKREARDLMRELRAKARRN